MESESSSLDSRDRAASAEAASTRPNPFDDSDSCSRKRRRTSTSGSPALGADTMNPIRDSPSSGTLEVATTVSDDTDATTVDKRPSTPKTPGTPRTPKTPKTPEQLADSAQAQAPPEPPSSRVTINLRNAVPDGATASSPESPTVQPQLQQPRPAPDGVKTSVEEPDLDMQPTPVQAVDTPQSSPSSTTNSPPIEVVAVQSDDEMALEEQSPDISIISENRVLVDPFEHFPYIQPHETLIDTLQRLISYLSGHINLDHTVLLSFQQWQEEYIRFANGVDQQVAREACCHRYRDFWQIYPEIILAMQGRRPSLMTLPSLRRIAFDFYLGFARLTAWMVTVDQRTTQELSSAQLQPDVANFLCPPFLQQLHVLIRALSHASQAGSANFMEAPEVSYLLSSLQDRPGGDMESLTSLAKAVVDFGPNFPKRLDTLLPIYNIVGDIMVEAANGLGNQSVDLPVRKSKLEMGHSLYVSLLDTLNTMIQRHALSLNSDVVSCCWEVLTELLKLSLCGDHEFATQSQAKHRELYPALPPAYTACAIVWEQRFTILAKVIQSSQMQLQSRVLAVETMSNDLVSFWKRHGDAAAADNSGTLYLAHIARYLLKSKLIEYILGPTCHPEIIVGSGNVIGFLVVTKLYGEEQTDLLWQGIISNQNTRTSDAMLRTINSITNLFDYPILLEFCKRLQKLPIENFNLNARSLWESISRCMNNRLAIDGGRATIHPYALCLRLLQESSVYALSPAPVAPNLDLLPTAVQRFHELCSGELDGEIREQLYQDCVKDLQQKSATTLGSIWCLTILIRPKVLPEMRFLIQTHNLTTLVVDELEHAIETGRSKGVATVLSGSTNQPRRDLIENIISIDPAKIDPDLGERFWELLVGSRALCFDDRAAAWRILCEILKKQTSKNLFLHCCLYNYLSSLASSLFCNGMLEFVREEALYRVNIGELALDNEEEVSRSCIEQLWRLVLEADDVGLVDRAIKTLAVDVYIESRQISMTSPHHSRRIHLAIVDRCLRQLKEAARKIKNIGQGLAEHDMSMQAQERIFTRSLTQLRYFLEAHQSKPHLAAPDLRTLISDAPYQVEGESAELKYQSFDGNRQTDVKPLAIGRLNTAASLLASLRQETGFENYRIYYRGRQFIPSEHDICKSLEDLRVHDGLILVKREENGPPSPACVKPGASSLEVEISAHFDELWEYLSMEEGLAHEIYHFLVKLPTDGHILKSIDSSATTFRDVFTPGQPYKTLYAIHALGEYAEAAFHGRINSKENADDLPPQRITYAEAVKRAMSLVVHAISDEEVLAGASPRLTSQMLRELVGTYLRFLDNVIHPTGFLDADVECPTPSRLLIILARAADSQDDISTALTLSTFIMILRLSTLRDEFQDDLTASPLFAKLLRQLLLTDSRAGVRGPTSMQIEELVRMEIASRRSNEAFLDSKAIAAPMTTYFWTIISDLLPLCESVPKQCEEVFRLALFLLEPTWNRAPDLLNLNELASKTGQLLLEHVSIEEVGKPTQVDLVARGLTSILHRCLQLDGSVSLSPTLPTGLTKAIIWKHLYPEKRDRNRVEPLRVVLNPETRAMLSDTLFQLVKHDKKLIDGTLHDINTLVPYYLDSRDDEDPYIYELQYHYDRGKALRSSCGYAGLHNLSNTCYLNSLFTQLFMNCSFRQFFLNMELLDPQNSQQLLFSTQQMFGYMQNSCRRSIDPSTVVSMIKTYDDTPIDINLQMDVDEFYNLLFDRWEGQLPMARDRRKLRSFYGGQLVQQVKSKECEHISERLEPFSAIQCDIKGKASLEESLQAYVDGEVMEGENKYKCSACDRHVNAVKRACLKDVPDHVIFHLKRFDFNLRTLQRSKINDWFSFPSELDLRPYTVEHLSDPLAEGEEDIFELVGILVHSGTAESGHYYSFIRERPSSPGVQKWVEFNDDIVSPWDPEELEASTFGGAGVYPPGDKTYSAYMLFYQRASSLRAEEAKAMASGIPAPVPVQVPGPLRDHILAENTLLLRQHCLADPCHANLVMMLFNRARALALEDPVVPNDVVANGESHPAQLGDYPLKLLAMETAISHLDQVISRTRDTPEFSAFARMIEEAVTSGPSWALAAFSYFEKRPGVIRALLQRHPDPRVRGFISSWFVGILRILSLHLPQLYYPRQASRASSEDEDDPNQEVIMDSPARSICENAMVLINFMWRFFHIHIKSWDEYFGAVLGFAQLGPREVSYLLGSDFLTKVLRIIAADARIDLPPNYARMLNSVLRRSNTRPPSYALIISLTRYLMLQMAPHLSAETITDDPRERLDTAVSPFRWTSEEVDLAHYSPEGHTCSLFVEKLLTHDQNQEHTHDILRLLVRSSSQMDVRVLHTIKKCVLADAATLPMEPYLKAAALYIESTRHLEYAKKLLYHVCMQAKNLQGTEGDDFLFLCKTALHLQKQDPEFAQAMYEFSMELIPKWAPLLLVDRDATIRSRTEELLDTELLRPEHVQFEDSQEDERRSVLIQQAMKQLGLSCLKFLQNTYIRRRVHLGQDAAERVRRVIEACTRVFDADPETQQEPDFEFFAMQPEVLSSLRRLVVEDIEDDGSDWEGSNGSSDQVDDIVEMNIQGVNELSDMDLT